MMSKYKQIKCSARVLGNAQSVYYNDGIDDIFDGKFYVWARDNNLCFFPFDFPAEKIRELAMLKDEGIISESEFEEKKRELLDRLIE